MSIFNQVKVDEPRAYTDEEVLDMWMQCQMNNAHYWNTVEADRNYMGAIPESTWMDVISGFMHSFHVVAAGDSGGFDGSCDMMAKARGSDKAYDINNAALQYTALDNADQREKNKNQLDSSDVNATDRLRLLWFIKLENLADKIDAMDLSKSEKTFAFIRELFDFIENGDENIERIDFILSPMEEDTEYFISEGENYYNPTVLTGQKEDLVTRWDRELQTYKHFRHSLNPSQ